MSEVAKAYVSLIPSAQGFGRGISGAIGGDLDRAGRDGGKRMSSGISGMLLPGFGKMAAVAGGLFGALALGEVASWGLEVASNNEQAKISFETMLGSASKADSFLRDLQKFAATTPFEFPELQSAASSLISIGIDANKVIPIMTTLGDVTSGMGTGSEGVKRATIALQQMNAAGRITAEDLNQLRDAGIPVFDLLAAATGKSKEEVAKLAQTGKLGKKELGQLMTALESGKGLERFSGLMEKQSKSLSGMVSTFKDTLGQGLATAIEPLIPLLKDGLGVAADVAAVAMKGLSVGLTWFVDIVKSVASAVGPAISQFFGSFSSEGSTASNFLTSVLLPAFEAVKSFIITQVVPAFNGIMSAVQGLVSTVLPIAQQFIAGMIARLAPLMPIIRTIFGTVGEIVMAAMGLIRAVIERVTSIVRGIWENWGNGIMNYVAMVWGIVTKVVSAALTVVRNVIRTVTAIIRGDWSGAWNGIKSIFSSVWNLIKTIVSGALTFIKSILSTAWAAIKSVASAAWNGVKSVISSAWESIKTAVRTKINEVIAFVKALPGKAISALGNIGSTLYSSGINLIGGFLRGIINKAGEIVGTLRDKVVGIIPDFIKDALGIHSPSRVMRALGEQTAAGMVLGLESGARGIDAAASKLVPSISPKTYTFGTRVNGSADGADARLMSDADIEALASAIRDGAREGTAEGYGYEQRTSRRISRMEVGVA